MADRYAHGDRGSLVEYLECLKAETIRYFAPVPASYFKSSTIRKRIIMLTNHTPASQGKAIPAPESFFLNDGIPSRFPLPEKFKGIISWGYDKEAIHPISKKKVMHILTKSVWRQA